MNRRALILSVVATALAVFAIGGFAYTRLNPAAPTTTVVSDATGLERWHSPVIGPMNAPVTVVEFFDPACEACRAFYPIVKQVMDRYPGQVRLVLRYAAFHNGSDEAVRILEAARKQDVFVPVLEALLAGQPTWASHGSPNLEAAWMMAAVAGLDINKGQEDARGEEVTKVLEQDAADVKTFNIRGTPTFFIAGEELVDFGPQQFADAVQAAVESAD